MADRRPIIVTWKRASAPRSIRCEPPRWSSANSQLASQRAKKKLNAAPGNAERSASSRGPGMLVAMKPMVSRSIPTTGTTTCPSETSAATTLRARIEARDCSRIDIRSMKPGPRHISSAASNTMITVNGALLRNSARRDGFVQDASISLPSVLAPCVRTARPEGQCSGLAGDGISRNNSFACRSRISASTCRTIPSARVKAAPASTPGA